ncbi:hypothetical protein ACFLWX_00005, partial [Chloroflexota bacterium]
CTVKTAKAYPPTRIKAECPRLICPDIPVITFNPSTAMMVRKVKLIKVTQVRLPVALRMRGNTTRSSIKVTQDIHCCRLAISAMSWR